METNKEKEVQALKSLIEFNNDRIEGYQKAAEETDYPDLKLLFNKFSSQSVKFSRELNNRIVYLGSEPVEGTTNSGKIFRAWMDVKAALTGKNRKVILSSCEFGEDVALKAYENTLEDNEISAETRTMLQEQVRTIRSAHNEIKSLRDLNIA